MYQEITGPEHWGPVQAADHFQTLGSYDRGLALGAQEGGPGSCLSSVRQTDRLPSLFASVSHLDTAWCCLALTTSECSHGHVKADVSFFCWGSALPAICAALSLWHQLGSCDVSLASLFTAFLGRVCFSSCVYVACRTWGQKFPLGLSR